MTVKGTSFQEECLVEDPSSTTKLMVEIWRTEANWDLSENMNDLIRAGKQ